MQKKDHPLTPRINKAPHIAGTIKILVYLPPSYRKPYWRMPKFRLGDWYVRDQFMWRKLGLSSDGRCIEAGTN